MKNRTKEATVDEVYNDENEILAVGKLAKPVKNDKELSLAFVVRFDTN